MSFDAFKFYDDFSNRHRIGFSDNDMINIFNDIYKLGKKDGEEGWPERSLYFQDGIDKATAALEACVEAMEMQMGREGGSFHISQKTARYIWDMALEEAKKVLEG